LARHLHFLQRLLDCRQGLTLDVADTRELLGWILSFGRGVHVVRPGFLQTRVREEARAIGRAQAVS
jgi:predicted DNA-binding transcriptional regulator YafY